jgi:hypothetical protein
VRGVKPKRKRIPKTISFCDESELVSLKSATDRVSRYIPDANMSEALRLGLQLTLLAPPALMQQAAQLVTRTSAGRPSSTTRFYNFSDDEEYLKEDDLHRGRLAWLEELQRLQQRQERDSHEERRINELYDLLGMVPKIA